MAPNNDSPQLVIYHPEINLRMKCRKCKSVAIPAYDGQIWFYKCQKCGSVMVHAHSCQDCVLLGTSHDAEFNDLHDEDGGQFLNAIGMDNGKIDVHAFSWVALHGCKTFRGKS